MSTALPADQAFASSAGQQSRIDAFGMVPWAGEWLQHAPGSAQFSPAAREDYNQGTGTPSSNAARPNSAASGGVRATPGYSDSADSGVGFSGDDLPSRANTTAALDLFGQLPFIVEAPGASSWQQKDARARRHTVANLSGVSTRTGHHQPIVHERDAISRTSQASVWEQAAVVTQLSSGFMSSHQTSPYASPHSVVELDDPSRFFPPDTEFTDGPNAFPQSQHHQLQVDEFGMTRLANAIPQTNTRRQMSAVELSLGSPLQGASVQHSHVSSRAQSPPNINSDGARRSSSDEDRSSEVSENYRRQHLPGADGEQSRIPRRTSHTFEDPVQLPRSPDDLFRRLPPDNCSWHLMYKANSDAQQKVTQAIWMPAVVVLGEDSTIYVYEHNPAMDNRDGSVDRSQLAQTFPLLELRLQQQMAFTEIVRKRVDRVSRTRVHSTKVQILEHTEKRRASVLFAISHEPERRTLLKIGSYDLLLLESFIEAVNESIRQLPLELRPQTVFRKNEVFVDCIDKCNIQMDYDGQVLSRLSTVQIMVQGFLTALPECELILNDSKRHSNNYLPASRHMITLDNEQLHPAVNQQLFDTKHRIRFRCMEAIRFEAIRFQWQPNAGQVRFAVESVEWHFPVPNSWHNILVTRTALGFRSVKSASSLRGSIHRKRRTQQASIQVNVGRAKYEPENSAIVWRIEEFPSAKGTRATFSGQLQLMPGMTKTDFVGETGTLRYTVLGSCISGTQIWSLSVPPTTSRTAKKWVRYETEFRHQVNLRPPMADLATDDD